MCSKGPEAKLVLWLRVKILFILCLVAAVSSHSISQNLKESERAHTEKLYTYCSSLLVTRVPRPRGYRPIIDRAERHKLQKRFEAEISVEYGRVENDTQTKAQNLHITSHKGLS